MATLCGTSLNLSSLLGTPHEGTGGADFVRALALLQDLCSRVGVTILFGASGCCPDAACRTPLFSHTLEAAGFCMHARDFFCHASSRVLQPGRIGRAQHRLWATAVSSPTLDYWPTIETVHLRSADIRQSADGGDVHGAVRGAVCAAFRRVAGFRGPGREIGWPQEALSHLPPVHSPGSPSAPSAASASAVHALQAHLHAGSNLLRAYCGLPDFPQHVSAHLPSSMVM